MENNPQTLEDLLLSLARQWQLLVLAMLLLTLISVAVCYLLLKSNRPLWAHRFMAIPVFLTTIPGIFYIMILVYLLFITRMNMLNVPVFYFFSPIWMGASLYLYRQLVDFEQVPGFNRLSGLMLFSAVVFAAIFLLARLRVIALIWITPVWLIPIVILFFIAGRYAWKRMTSKQN